MTETARIQASCDGCGHRWNPYGLQKYILPHSDTLKCPKCGLSEEMQWLDTETAKKNIQKKLGLISNEELSNKMTDLEKKVSLLQQELDIERQKRELSQAELEKVKDWAKGREKDFREIEIIAEEERERMANNDDMV